MPEQRTAIEIPHRCQGRNGLPLILWKAEEASVDREVVDSLRVELPLVRLYWM